jgi:hypothetical protein
MTRRNMHIPIDERRIKDLVRCEMNKLPSAANAALEDPITMDELLNAVRKEKARKSPGQDGMCNEFYRMTWDATKGYVGCDEPRVHEWVGDRRT